VVEWVWFFGGGGGKWVVQGGPGWLGFFFSGGSVPEAKGQPTGELLRARAQNETS